MDSQTSEVELNTSTTIAIASDHAGYELKVFLKEGLQSKGWSVLDLGCHDKTMVDYPIYGRAMAEAIRLGQAAKGILICGTGIGISIAANRHLHVRAAVVHDGLGARLAREHNDANVLCLGAQVIGQWVARDCVDSFLNTGFAQGRHTRRVEMLGEDTALR
jgi:ribose 5-phosphate isomerase B